MAGERGTPWAPPPDDELTWFRPSGRLAARPRLLDFTFEIDAFAFGISRALESLYFPFYELRARLVEGEIYFASVPSPYAERDIDTTMQRIRDSGLRFTRSIRRTWDRPIRGQVEEYNDRMAAFPLPDASGADVAVGLRRLKRTRANQWFAATRAVFAPRELLEQGVGETPADEAMAVVHEALTLVRDRGTEILDRALLRVGERLVLAGSLVAPEDVHWLDYEQVREALGRGGMQHQTVAAAQNQAARATGASVPETIGPALPPDAPRMYLIREILALLS